MRRLDLYMDDICLTGVKNNKIQLRKMLLIKISSLINLILFFS